MIIMISNMEQLQELSILLGRMGVFTCSIDFNLDFYKAMEAEIYEYEKDHEFTIFAQSDKKTITSPYVTVKLRGVKICIKCPFVRFEA